MNEDDKEEPPQQSQLVTEKVVLEEIKECTVDISLLRASEVQRFMDDQPDSGINEDEKTPSPKNSSKKILHDEQETLNSSPITEEITSPKEIVEKIVTVKERGRPKITTKSKAQKKAEKENKDDNKEKNLKRKKTDSESSEASDNGRAKRQKRKEVVYTEPNLGAKLRRPKEFKK